MKLATIVKTSFIISFISTLIGAYFKIIHSEGGETLLMIGIIVGLIFIVSAIYEVRTSKKISNAEKTMWTIAFFFMSGITGLIYFFIGRKRIIEII